MLSEQGQLVGILSDRDLFRATIEHITASDPVNSACSACDDPQDHGDQGALRFTRDRDPDDSPSPV